MNSCFKRKGVEKPATKYCSAFERMMPLMLRTFYLISGFINPIARMTGPAESSLQIVFMAMTFYTFMI